MYCAGCGSLISAELKYCKSCGMRLLTEEKTENATWILPLMVIVFGIVAIVGLGTLIALIALMLDRGATEKIVGITIVFYLACFTGIEFILGAQISKLINASVRKEKKSTPETTQPAQISAKNTAQLPEPMQMPPSVTENTTQFFEKVPLRES
jgi:hypothetical protein